MKIKGFLPTKATSKIKHFRRGGSCRWKHMFLATADGKTAASDKTQPEPAFEWVLSEVDKRVVSKRVVLADVPLERKPE